MFLFLCRRGQQAVDLGHDFEGIGDLADIGLAAGPAAVGIEIDGAAFADEAPADYVGFFTVAARGEPLGVTRSRARLTDLVEMGHGGEDSLVFAGLIDEGFAAAEGCAGRAKEFED